MEYHLTAKEADINQWVDTKTWGTSWTALRTIPGGGQGKCSVVRQVGGSGAERFLKVPRQQQDKTARQRFHREAIAYSHFSHVQLPRLIESNAHKADDQSYKLYVVTELIQGLNLKDYIAKFGHLSLNDGLTLTTQLLEIIKHLHSCECIHRDIKPGNIILRADNFFDPVLVDFGLNYRSGSNDLSDLTEAAQEIGNRFLRLPELACQSTLKRDARSDIAFVGGILFFSITGVVPAILLDQDSRMPHQRSGPLEILRNIAGAKALQLMALFDRVFASNIRHRFKNADEMLNAIKSLQLVNSQALPHTIQKMEAEVAAQINNVRNKEIARARSATQGALNQVMSVAVNVANSTNGLYDTTSAGHMVSNTSNVLQYGFFHIGNQGHRFMPEVATAISGDELVVRIGGDQVLRTDAFDPNFDQAFKDRVRVIYLEGLKGLLETE